MGWEREDLLSACAREAKRTDSGVEWALRGWRPTLLLLLLLLLLLHAYTSDWRWSGV